MHYVTRQTQGRIAFTLVELLVVISVIVLLISILLPALQSARKAAQSTQCLSGLRQISIGVVSYLLSNKTFPLGTGTSQAWGLKGFMKDNNAFNPGTGVYFARWAREYGLAPKCDDFKNRTREDYGLFQCPGKPNTSISGAFDASYLAGNVVAAYDGSGRFRLTQDHRELLNDMIRFYGEVPVNTLRGWMRGPIKTKGVRQPGIMPLFFDEAQYQPATAADFQKIQNNHTGFINVNYFDGSARSQKNDPLQSGGYIGQPNYGSFGSWYFPYVRAAPFPSF